MWLPTPIYERIPQFWFLLGLLFVATGLYLGFEYPLSFLYMMIGWSCSAYGLAVFLLRLRERPKGQTAGVTRKPIEFASAEPGHAAPVHAMSEDDHVPVPEQTGSE